ncbi:hypothetical protein BH10PLA1_BH10PLA1_02240 [soil metagenome]
MRSVLTWVAAGVLGLSSFVYAAGEPIFRYAGDGLTINVTEWSDETGDVKGDIRRGQEVWPFKGKVSGEKEDAINGTFNAGGTEYPFTTKIDVATDSFSFTSGGKTYQLKPLGEGANEPAKPIDRPEVPAREPRRDGPPVAADPKPAGELPAVLKLKQHVFPDISMGAPAAYTVLTPPDWTAKGNVEWQLVGEVPFPQMRFEITSPAGGKIMYVPQVTIVYSNAPGMGETGIPAPQNFPKWLEEAITRSNQRVTNVKLIESHRDANLEKIHADIDRIIGARNDGSKREAWMMTFEFDEAGVHQREEFLATYNVYPPFNGLNGFFTQTWAFFTSQIVSAPADKFDAMKKDLYAVCGTVHATPGWFTQSQKQIAENSQRRTANIWEAIKRRGEQINQVSDADYAKYKKDNFGDGGQRKRINSIYETDDFRDTNGDIVNLPMHYKNVFSDGKGNYVLSNNSQDKPGELWNTIEPMR